MPVACFGLEVSFGVNHNQREWKTISWAFYSHQTPGWGVLTTTRNVHVTWWVGGWGGVSRPPQASDCRGGMTAKGSKGVCVGGGGGDGGIGHDVQRVAGRKWGLKGLGRGGHRGGVGGGLRANGCLRMSGDGRPLGSCQTPADQPDSPKSERVSSETK